MLRIAVDPSGVFVSGHFAADDEAFVPIDRLRVDTGYSGFLGFPLGHQAVRNAWLSAECGRANSWTVLGPMPSWTGAGSALVVDNILVSPIPITVSAVTGPPATRIPLLGRAWFEQAAAVWIDLEQETIAMSFQPGTAAQIVAEQAGSWLETPWRTITPNGHRFVPILIGSEHFEAVIDTGSPGELHLNSPPDQTGFASDTPRRRRIFTGAGSAEINEAISRFPLVLGAAEFHGVAVSWPDRVYAMGPQAPPAFAVLGVRFLKKAPVLLDPRNDRVYFYVGDPSQRPDFSTDGEMKEWLRRETASGAPGGLLRRVLEGCRLTGN